MHRRVFILISLLVGIAGVVPLSAQVTAKFKAESTRLQTAARELAIARGLSERELLRNAITSPFKGPAAKIQKVLPGGSVSVHVTGDFPVGTKFLSERDEVTISDAAQSATTYSARLTIPPDDGPGFIRLWAISPVGVEGFAAVALVETLYRFDLKSPNGYKVKIAPVEKTFTIRDNVYGSVKYQAEFYKPGETKPFETTTGDQTFSINADANSMLDISVDQSTTSPQAEIEAISKKMSDPKTTVAERNALMARMGQVQSKMLEEMTNAFKTDPASLNKKQDDFGCGEVRLYPGKGGVVEGSISCGKNFNDGVLKVTGTMTQLH